MIITYPRLRLCKANVRVAHQVSFLWISFERSHSASPSDVDESTESHMTRPRNIFLAFLLTLGALGVHAQTQTPAASAQSQLKTLLDEDLDATLRRNPLNAT